MTALAEPAGNRRSLLLSAAWAYYSGYVLWAGAMLAGLVPRSLANDLFFLPLYFAAGLAGRHAARFEATSPRAARGWRLVAAAWFSSGVAAILMTALWRWEIAWLGTLASALYQLYFPLLLLGFWHFVEFPSGALARFRLTVEGLIVVVATTILAWYWVFRFDEAARSLLPYLKIILLLFPGELAFAVGAVAMPAAVPTDPPGGGPG